MASVHENTFDIQTLLMRQGKWPADVQLSGISIAIAIAASTLLWYAGSMLIMHYGGPKAPLVGIKSIFEPRYWSSLRFFRQASNILEEGYKQYPNQTWKFARADTDVMLLPPKYVEELRSLSHDVASPTIAHAFNLSGEHTNMNIILRNNLHFRTLQEKLTPNLGKLCVPVQEELNYGIERELPDSEDEWTAIKPYHSILRLVSRISARIFVGIPYCRDEEWLEISTQFTENTFVSLVILRLFPRYLHGPVSWLLPSTYKCTSYIRRAKRLLSAEIERRQKAASSGQDTKADRQPNLLDWMIDLASPLESKAADLAHLEVVMSLASVHTSQMNAVHVLYDLCTLDGFIEELRQEITEVITEDGPWSTWQKTSYYKLKKLDSLIRESQRWNPPTLLSYHRVMMRDLVLRDGTYLPRGAHIAMPVNAIQNRITPRADVFDPLRYYHLRQRPNEQHLHQFTTTEPEVLNFGHGKYACPGRFFAALEIKSILVRLIMDYDWQLKDGVRPPNLNAHEFIFPNEKAELFMKRRKAKDRLYLGK